MENKNVLCRLPCAKIGQTVNMNIIVLCQLQCACEHTSTCQPWIRAYIYQL